MTVCDRCSRPHYFHHFHSLISMLAIDIAITHPEMITGKYFAILSSVFSCFSSMCNLAASSISFLILWTLIATLNERVTISISSSFNSSLLNVSAISFVASLIFASLVLFCLRTSYSYYRTLSTHFSFLRTFILPFVSYGVIFLEKEVGFHDAE